MISYSNLLIILQRLESKWQMIGAPPAPGRFPSHTAIRVNAPPALGNVQYFACDDSTKGMTLPIVFTVGINYTQGNTPNPGINVEDKVPQAKRFVRNCINSFNLHPVTWRNSCLASMNLVNPIFSINQDFHLVMTNLSPCITNNSWSAIDPALAADLLVSPPHLPINANIYDHISDLKNSIVDQNDSLWIGHTLGGEVPSHFRCICGNLSINRWLLTANIAYGFSWRYPNTLTGMP
jgi:hypothetical protein